MSASSSPPSSSQAAGAGGDSGVGAAPPARTNPNHLIRPMDKEAVRRIVTGQAIMDLTSCVKELLDNAIDAGARNINIRLFQQGLHIVEVSDDGHGVPANCRRLLAAAHATSKIRSMREIGNSLGFRGEALHSLAALCEKLIVATRVDGEDLAEKLEFRNDGTVDETATSRFPRKVGTTVAVLNFFQPIPVRRMHLKEQISNQRAKLVSMVEAYAIFHPGVRIHLMDIVGQQCNERTVLSTAYNCTTLPETISSVLGSAFLESLCPVELHAPDLSLVVSGMISRARASASAPGGRGTTSLPTRKLFAINKRPVELPKLKRLLNDLWSRGRFVAPRDASWCLDLSIPIDLVDVNLSPDKRAVALKQEDQVFERIATYAQELWTSHTAGHFDVDTRREHVRDVEDDGDSEDSSSAGDMSDADGKGRRDDDSTSPSRFNRRYAFSHDVSKARLQHEFDDGRKRRREEPDLTGKPPEVSREQVQVESSVPTTSVGPGQKRYKQLQITSFVSASTKSMESTNRLEPVTPSPVTASANDGPQSEDRTERASDQVKSRVVSANKLEESGQGDCDARSETHDEAPTDDVPPETLRTSPSPTPLTRTSWAEQAQWRLAQQAFNGTSSGSNAIASSGLEEDIRVVGASAPKFGFAQFGLNQSGGTSRGKAVASEPARIERESSNGTTDEDGRFVERKPNGSSGRRHSDASRNAQGKEGNGTNVPAKSPDVEANNEAETSQASSDSTRTVQEEDERCLSGDSAMTTQPAARKSASEVTWDTFGTTHDVVMAARRERLALRDRKRAFDDPRKRPPEGYTNESIQLRKEDFAGMSVVGQFNCGFILAKSPDNHLWILDQHACDEKANFERLCEESSIVEQRLVIPLPLELTLPEEMCVMDHLDVFEKNGFRFQIDNSKPPRHRLSLTALPQSGATDGRKSVVFGKDDVSALCAILGASDDEGALSASLADGAGTGVDGGGVYGNNAVRRHAGAGLMASQATSSQRGSTSSDKILARLPKAIAMFASRACRSSIMIGKVLSTKEMDRVVAKMKELKDPWTCAHGRPTIRHVSDLHGLLGRDEARARSTILCATTTLCTQHGDGDGDDEGSDTSEGEDGSR